MDILSLKRRGKKKKKREKTNDVERSAKRAGPGDAEDTTSSALNRSGSRWLLMAGGLRDQRLSFPFPSASPLRPGSRGPRALLLLLRPCPRGSGSAGAAAGAAGAAGPLLPPRPLRPAPNALLMRSQIKGSVFLGTCATSALSLSKQVRALAEARH